MNGPLLILVEGANDLEFLLRLTGQLRREFRDLPDLEQWQAEGRILVVPVGGGDPASWPNRLSSLGLREFHLFTAPSLCIGHSGRLGGHGPRVQPGLAKLSQF